MNFKNPVSLSKNGNQVGSQHLSYKVDEGLQNQLLNSFFSFYFKMFLLGTMLPLGNMSDYYAMPVSYKELSYKELLWFYRVLNE